MLDSQFLRYAGNMTFFALQTLFPNSGITTWSRDTVLNHFHFNHMYLWYDFYITCKKMSLIYVLYFRSSFPTQSVQLIILYHFHFGSNSFHVESNNVLFILHFIISASVTPLRQWPTKTFIRWTRQYIPTFHVTLIWRSRGIRWKTDCTTDGTPSLLTGMAC